MLRPGAERIARAGRPAPLHELAAADPDRFRRLPGHVAGEAAQDRRGRRHLPLASRRQPRIELTPERAIEIQHLLGADITMVLDECTPFPGDARRGAAIDGAVDALGGALARRRSRRARATACSASSRAASIPSCAPNRPRRSRDIGFDGYAVGGLAVGEGQETMFAVLDATVPALPEDRPRYLMGVGKPADHRRRGAARHRHVRLRAADPLGPHRPGLHPPRHGQSAQCAPSGRSAAARCRVPLPGLHAAIRRAYLHHLVRARRDPRRACC